MFGGYEYDGESFYDGYETYLEEESFDEHYGDEIEDRVIPAMEPDDTPPLPFPSPSDLPWSMKTYQQQQLELGGAY